METEEAFLGILLQSVVLSPYSSTVLLVWRRLNNLDRPRSDSLAFALKYDCRRALHLALVYNSY